MTTASLALAGASRVRVPEMVVWHWLKAKAGPGLGLLQLMGTVPDRITSLERLLLASMVNQGNISSLNTVGFYYCSTSPFPSP